MAYVATVTSPARKMFRKFPSQIKKHLVSEAKKLSQDYTKGEKLSGILNNFWSLHVTYQKTQYRIIYEINDDLDEIVIRAVGKRENFYKRLERMNLK